MTKKFRQNIVSQSVNDRLKVLENPTLDPEQYTLLTASVLEYMGSLNAPPKLNSKKVHTILLLAIERVDWSLYPDNFVHLVSNFYPYALHTPAEDDDDFLPRLKKLTFSKISALAYALVSDVHPDRRYNLKERLNFWANVSVPDTGGSMVESLVKSWGLEKEGVDVSSYGDIMSSLNPATARNAATLVKIWKQIQGLPCKQEQTLNFQFDASF